MLRLRAGEQRSFFEMSALALVLSTVAGAVNASGLLAAGAMTSHMTGNVTRVGEGLALGNQAWVEPARHVAFFLLGAFLATVGVNLLRRLIAEPVPALLVVEAALLVAVADVGRLSSQSVVVTELLCLAMGWQNALITRISGAVVRTTHVTGATTDLGIELGHLVFSRPRVLQAVAEKGLVRALREIPPGSDLARAALHLMAIGFFFVGALLGPLLFVRYGYPAMVAPALLLVTLVLFDLAVRRASLRQQPT